MIIKIIVALLVFMIVVTFHEFGHFIIAKKSKIKVNEFAIGMGPKLFSKQKGETLYSLRVLPLGGYCAMEGEDEAKDQNQTFLESGNFNDAPIWSRIFTVFAGPLFNFILAFLIMFILFTVRGYQTTTISNVMDNSIAKKFGIESGDRIIKIENYDIKDWVDIQNSLSKVDSKDVNIIVLRNNEKKDIKVSFEQSNKKILGITSKLKRNPFVSIKESFKTTIYFINTMFDILKQLFTGKVGIGQLSGPIGVVGAISSAASNGIYSLMYITAFLSVNLGFINLLPIPALDGGRLLFLIIELIKGKPISREKEGLVHTVGFVCLMCLILFVSFKDIIRLGIFGVK